MSDHVIKTYQFLPDKEMMVERMKIWHKMFLEDGLTVEQSRHFMKEMYLKCDEAFGWSVVTYQEMIDRATA